MHIDAQSLTKGPKRFDLKLDGEALDLQSDRGKLNGEVAVNGEAIAKQGGLEISAKIAADLEIECSRCLEPVSYPMDVHFVGRYVEPEQFASNDEHGLGADDLDIDVIENGSLDLAAVIREQLLLNIPEQLFCRDDCIGLCEICGSNRNLVDCNCIGSEVDPRWAALKNLN